MELRPLRVLFVVQGEGRGHMTQALALREMLTQRGHTVCGVLVGQSARRKAPDFFVDGIQAPIFFFESPNFVTKPGDPTIRLGATLVHSARRLRRYLYYVELIERQIAAKQPDVIVNFYEPLIGLYSLLKKPTVPIVSVGHQYMFHHASYPFASGQTLTRALMKLHTRLTAGRSVAKLALSFYEADDLPEHAIRVVPPILRQQVFEVTPTTEDFLLVYLLDARMADDLVRWHEAHPDVRLHCFWDRTDKGREWAYSPTLTFHQLDGPKFLDHMARCRGVVCTAGFESVSEAMYLGKPTYMVPVPKHYEQRCNALDAQQVGAGLAGDRLDLDAFLAYLPTHKADPAVFQRWVHQAEGRFIRAIEQAGGYPISTEDLRALPTPVTA